MLWKTRYEKYHGYIILIGEIKMGVTDFDVYGKYKFGKEGQNTYFWLTVEACSESNAMDKARMIADKVTWTSVSKNDSEA